MFHRFANSNKFLNCYFSKTNKTAEKYSENGSGFVIKGIKGLDLHITLADYSNPIGKKGPKIPDDIKEKQAVIN